MIFDLVLWTSGVWPAISWQFLVLIGLLLPGFLLGCLSIAARYFSLRVPLTGWFKNTFTNFRGRFLNPKFKEIQTYVHNWVISLWPARSLDFTTLDLYLWSQLKPMHEVISLQEILQNISTLLMTSHIKVQRCEEVEEVCNLLRNYIHILHLFFYCFRMRTPLPRFIKIFLKPSVCSGAPLSGKSIACWRSGHSFESWLCRGIFL